MIRLLFRPALALTILLALSVVLMRAQPAEDTSIRQFLSPDGDCAALCLLGLRPGVTTVGQAMNQLRSHEWVSSTHMNATGRGYADIEWQWSGQQPDIIDPSRPGRVTFYWDRDEDDGRRQLTDMLIETVSIHTRIRFYEAQMSFGLPDTGTAAYRPDADLGYSAVYNNSYGMVDLSTVLPCPANLLTFWDARTRITLSSWRGTGRYVPPPEAVKMC
jgi:hypothetical protein